MAQILEFIGCILEFIVDFQFWKDKKKQRQFEKENNLPKKQMLHPLTKPTMYLLLITTLLLIVFSFYQHYYSNTKNTIKKITDIENLILENKEADGYYPEKLEAIIRNNPLRKNITLDAWGNEFHYQILENSFILKSKGRDGILNTDDDIKPTN